MNRRTLSLTPALLLLLVTGCGGDGFTSETVQVGAVYPFSGDSADVGAEIQQGLELARDIINGEHPELDLPLAPGRGLPGLDGAPLQVLYADTGGTPGGAREAARSVIGSTVALLGAYQSVATASASEVAETAGLPFLNPESTDPSLTERGYAWFFRTTPDDRTFVTNAFAFITDLNAERDAGLARLAVVHEGTGFGRGFMNLVEEGAPQYGLELVGEVVADGLPDNVPAGVAAVRAAEPDVVLFAVYEEDAVRYMQEFKRQDYAPPLIWANDAGFVSPAFQERLGADAAYVTSREVWSAALTQTNPLAAEVNDLYRARYGTDLNGNSARAFIGLLTLAEAIDRAASTEPDAIRAALTETHIPAEQLIVPWQGVRFDSSGQNTLGDGIVVQMFEDGYAVVWPHALALEPVVFPFPAWGAR
ncbi:ABC transporter substrate-binding protein [Ectothiorhodospiraceae bacterium 2226]|nr:ABC transporter substrate-binding protein [Ectothiorhodospiraceae bacterium 2226]